LGRCTARSPLAMRRSPYAAPRCCGSC
jgi:hypothetical protein